MLNRLKWLWRKIFTSNNPDLTHPSRAFPSEIWLSKPNDRLIDLLLAAAPVARTVDHQDIADKMIEFPHWPQMWPGEHYKLLSGLVSVLQPKVVIEIGTGSGYSALAMKKYLPANGKLYSFDIRPWRTVSSMILKESDFADGRLEHILDDLGDSKVFARHADLLRHASLILIDAPKSEERLIKNFDALDFVGEPVFIVDCIRLNYVVPVWESITKPKLDATTFGHWAGTGLIDWKKMGQLQ